jgi:uncharacterized protein (UPF0332 family)
VTGDWQDALSAAADARVLIGAERWSGTANRIYYVMFHAARAALSKVRAGQTMPKTHRGLIQSFTTDVVMAHKLDPGLSGLLSAAELLRLTADYRSAVVSETTARQAAEDMDTFLSAIAVFIGAPWPPVTP